MSSQMVKISSKFLPKIHQVKDCNKSIGFAQVIVILFIIEVVSLNSFFFLTTLERILFDVWWIL